MVQKKSRVQPNSLIFYSYFTDILNAVRSFYVWGNIMSELNRNETIQAFASAASLLIDQYIASERLGWDGHLSALPVSNSSGTIRKAS